MQYKREKIELTAKTQSAYGGRKGTMKICVDENIALGKEVFSLFGDVELFNGRNISGAFVKDCDVLIVRSVTKVNEELLSGSKVKFVGTTTIGTDHIDIDFLKKNGIGFAYAPGCNSRSVAEYVFSSLFYLSKKYGFRLGGKSIGIIGVGNIGKIVERFSNALGMRVVKNDPPREDKGEKGFSALEDALACDIVTFHVPLILSGKYKTVHLLNNKNIDFIKENAILINSSRGVVVDNKVALNLVRRGKIKTIFDVWENEPEPDKALVELADIATPHIAGYSYDGRLNGTKMIFEALNKFLGTSYVWNFDVTEISGTIDLQDENDNEYFLRKLFEKVYRAEEDSKKFKRLYLTSENPRKEFDLFRKNYLRRFEIPDFRVKVNEEIDRKLLEAFGVRTV